MTEETLSQLQAWTLPWARANHPDWYEATLKVARNPKSFNTYLIRLAERRWEEDRGARLSAPIMVLEETALTIRTRDKRTNEMLEFSGRLVAGRRRAIAELAMPREEFDHLESYRKEWDLEYAGTEN